MLINGLGANAAGRGVGSGSGGGGAARMSAWQQRNIHADVLGDTTRMEYLRRSAAVGVSVRRPPRSSDEIAHDGASMAHFQRLLEQSKQQKLTARVDGGDDDDEWAADGPEFAEAFIEGDADGEDEDDGDGDGDAENEPMNYYASEKAGSDHKTGLRKAAASRSAAATAAAAASAETKAAAYRALIAEHFLAAGGGGGGGGGGSTITPATATAATATAAATAVSGAAAFASPPNSQVTNSWRQRKADQLMRLNSPPAVAATATAAAQPIAIPPPVSIYHTTQPAIAAAHAARAATTTMIDLTASPIAPLPSAIDGKSAPAHAAPSAGAAAKPKHKRRREIMDPTPTATPASSPVAGHTGGGGGVASSPPTPAGPLSPTYDGMNDRPVRLTPAAGGASSAGGVSKSGELILSVPRARTTATPATAPATAPASSSNSRITDDTERRPLKRVRTEPVQPMPATAATAAAAATAPVSAPLSGTTGSLTRQYSLAVQQLKRSAFLSHPLRHRLDAAVASSSTVAASSSSFSSSSSTTVARRGAAAGGSKKSWDHLGPDLHLLIFKYLPVRAIASYSLTSVRCRVFVYQSITDSRLVLPITATTATRVTFSSRSWDVFLSASTRARFAQGTTLGLRVTGQGGMADPGVTATAVDDNALPALLGPTLDLQSGKPRTCGLCQSMIVFGRTACTICHTTVCDICVGNGLLLHCESCEAAICEGCVPSNNSEEKGPSGDGFDPLPSRCDFCRKLLCASCVEAVQGSCPFSCEPEMPHCERCTLNCQRRLDETSKDSDRDFDDDD